MKYQIKLRFRKPVKLLLFLLVTVVLNQSTYSMDDDDIIDITGLNYGILQLTIELEKLRPDIEVELNHFTRLLEKNLLWSGYFDLRKKYEETDLRLKLRYTPQLEIQAWIYSQEGTLLYTTRKALKNRNLFEENVIALVEEIIVQLTGEKSILKSAIAYVKHNRNKHYQLILADAFGKNQRLLYEDGNYNILPRWSPDASSLLFTSLTGKGSLIMSYRISDRTIKPLFKDLGKLSGGTWGQNGREIILTLTKAGNPDLFLLKLKSGKAKRLTFRSSSESNPRWSPDGRRLLFVSNRSGTVQIYQRILRTGEIFRMTYEGTYNVEPNWSNDGAYIVFSGMTEEKKYQIFIMDREGEFVQQLTFGSDSAEQPVWSPNGRQILYVSKVGYDQKLFLIRADGSLKRRLTETSSGTSEFNPTWTANFLWKKDI